jgi:hypothetical protein
MLKVFKSRSLRVSLCGEYVNHFQGQESGLQYFHRLFCYDSTCPVCNSKGGMIHKRRKLLLLERIKKSYGILEGLALGKFVFTLPSEIRPELLSRNDLNAFIRLVRGVMKSFYPDRLICYSIHFFGDRDLIFKPHINAYVVERLDAVGGCEMKLKAEFLAAVKSAYLLALEHAGHEINGVVVHYSFTLKARQFLHSIKYFSRPCPDYNILMKLADENVSLYDFLISDEMKGFQFIRYSRGGVASNQYKTGEGGVLVKMEKLVFKGREKFNHKVFIDEWRVYERIEVLPGIYCCRSGGFTPADKVFLKEHGLLDDLLIHK